MKLWWPHDEILISSLMLYKDTGKEEYLDWFYTTLDYCKAHFADSAYGEWYGYLRRDGKPTEPSTKGSTFKGPFHLPRMLIMTDVMAGELLEIKTQEKRMEQGSTNVFERISAEYYNLTTAEKKAADYVLSHQRKAQDMSITELAAASGVAEATVSRFCRRLGCKGYNAFRLAIANSIAQRPEQPNPLSGEVLDDDSFSDVCKKLLYREYQRYDADTRACPPGGLYPRGGSSGAGGPGAVHGTGRLYDHRHGGGAFFPRQAGKFFSVTDSHMQAIAIATAGENDVILFFLLFRRDKGSDRNSLLRARARSALHSRHTLCQLSRRRILRM